jgi:hypothetical protein
MKKLLVALLLVAVMFGCTQGGTKDVTKKGTYQTAAGDDGSYATAEVTLVNDKITEVSIDAFHGSANEFKKTLGEGYGMRGASPIGKEWFEQIAALEQWMIGKTIDEVMAMPVYAKDDNHTSVPDVEDLKTSVTIDVGASLEAVKGAVDAAKVVE